jgi:hypothetical protein
MKLRFNRADVQKLIDHSKGAKEHRHLYEDMPEIAVQLKPGELILVGDQGVYLMSGAKDSFPHPDAKEGETKQFVVYAKEVNPETLPFDEWWANKRLSFGGDDGIEVIPGDFIEGMLKEGTKNVVCINMSSENFSVARP